ncbi:M24 family metallopeptidase [Fertoebacter nigrum]|uniref:M24 family metallopeptidase n=1 Tax=Fertoeibacter niger TaxID=2656921 RepID=A0A8X8H339_9RHOB|nr:aminopeptidase P family N-terminal domain-containing protein [Fertoeibacter niger]NUB44723.1 M24 family metallopeptidase [Fertoeibacter niger]
MARLIEIDWPDFGTPAVPAQPDLAAMRGRMAALRAAMAGRGLDCLVVYGDREHAANLHWITGFDPRFEEAVLIVTPAAALLLAGNECLPYTGVSPLVAAGDIAVGHCATLSLPSQPREGRRLGDWLTGAVPAGCAMGAVGWKMFGPEEVAADEAVDIPAFLADPLRRIASRVENATDLLMHPGHGLRCTVDADEIARLEFANHMAATALRRMVFAFRDGMVDFDAYRAAQVGGLPLGCHPTFATGARAEQGLSGPTGEVLRRGNAISFNICHWGANICRAGWLAETEADLPAAARDYLGAFAGPYVAALSDWFGLMRPGVAGGAVWARMRERLPLDGFNVTLNPGHLIGLDEWVSSPIYPGSDLPLRTGMAMQCDVIPAHPVYGSTRMEDGYAIADAELRADLVARFPAVAARCAARAGFMRDVIGLDVPDSLLPLADTCGIVAPFLLAPRRVIAL